MAKGKGIAAQEKRLFPVQLNSLGTPFPMHC